MLPYLLLLSIALAVFLFPKGERAKAEQRVITVWNVDTFEGGKGSRTAFLRSVAGRVEEKREGVYYLISSYTAEGAKQAAAEGKAPDMLSFGIGLAEFSEQFLPLPGKFAGGELGGKTYALPWCAGSYFLFSEEEDFDGAGQTAISCGGSNLPQVAAALAGIKGEELPSLSAYTAFLSGKYRYLLGTQRDICRFAARSVQVFQKKLTAYGDLYQYISVLSARHSDDCLAFLEELLSKRTQGELERIGMFPPDEAGAQRTSGAFLSEEGRLSLLQAAREQKNLGKYLKTI